MLASQLARPLEGALGAPLEKFSLRWTGWESAFAGSNATPEAGFQHLVEKINHDAQLLGAETRLGEAVLSLERRDDGG